MDREGICPFGTFFRSGSYSVPSTLLSSAIANQPSRRVRLRASVLEPTSKRRSDSFAPAKKIMPCKYFFVAISVGRMFQRQKKWHEEKLLSVVLYSVWVAHAPRRIGRSRGSLPFLPFEVDGALGSAVEGMA